ncbi:hypothetical protein MP638_004590 [Amoeboaphelidium occidentale]|nr:hypothetical protein MP638_004590 [Amoeboaphelidium occidentale]
MSQEYTLRILLTSSSNGLKSDFKFAKSSSSSASASASSAASAAVSIQEVKEHIYNNWPTEKKRKTTTTDNRQQTTEMSQEYTLRILLTSSSNGLKSDFKFAKSSSSASASASASAAVSIQEVKEHIYNNWPTELQIPLNEVTTMHLLIKIDTANATGGVGGKDGNKKKCLLM